MIKVINPLAGPLNQFAFVEGTSHQAGSSQLQGSMWHINECLKITKDFDTGDVILGLNRNVGYSYGIIVQIANGVSTWVPCLAWNDQITLRAPLRKANGAYPAIIATTILV